MTPAAERSDFGDAVRAFALVGICVVNLPFLAQPALAPRMPVSLPDVTGQVLVSFFFEAKFFLLFSFLFGFGFAAQLRKIANGSSTGASFGRRLSGLLAFGLLHAVFLFPGDILVGYAVLGALLWSVRTWSDQHLLRLAGCIVPLAALLLGAIAVAVGSEDPAVLAAEQEAAVRAYRDGGFADAVTHRLHELVFIFPFIALFNWPLAFGAFCVGLVAGRRGFLDDPHRLVTRVRPFLGPLLLVAVPGNLLFAAIPWLPDALAVAGMAGVAVAAPSLTVLYVFGLARLWTGDGGARRLLQRMAPAGRMSLTNYLGQSVVANLTFMGWGLGLFGQLDRAAQLGLSIGIAAALIAASLVWLRWFAYGPDEWLLRSWTQLRWVRLRRPAPGNDRDLSPTAGS